MRTPDSAKPLKQTSSTTGYASDGSVMEPTASTGQTSSSSYAPPTPPPTSPATNTPTPADGENKNTSSPTSQNSSPAPTGNAAEAKAPNPNHCHDQETTTPTPHHLTARRVTRPKVVIRSRTGSPAGLPVRPPRWMNSMRGLAGMSQKIPSLSRLGMGWRPVMLRSQRITRQVKARTSSWPCCGMSAPQPLAVRCVRLLTKTLIY